MTAPVQAGVRANTPDSTLLSIDGLCAGYGRAQVLHGVSFSVGHEAVGLVGRNGMGKSTLCNTIMGLVRPTAGSIRFDGDEIGGMAPEQVARRGIAYVPQGRRLFPSLTVDEHLRMLAKKARGKRWTPDAVYELFPRLAARRRNGGAELSGGEQQMLAVARALEVGPSRRRVGKTAGGVERVLDGDARAHSLAPPRILRRARSALSRRSGSSRRRRRPRRRRPRRSTASP